MESTILNANDILFRCSSLGHLMTDARSKNETLSETTKTHLIDVYTSNKYQRFEEITGKMLDKGNEVEEDSITIVSRITKQFLKKNEQHLSNEFIKGTPDLFIGESIDKATRIRDTKSSWSVFTFQRSINKELLKNYYWQGQGYMALTGAKVCNIDYCLNNTPYHILEGELRKESYNHLNNDTPNWIELQMIANHVYDLKTFNEYVNRRGIGFVDENDFSILNGFIEIPLKERFFTFEFDRNDEDIERLYQRIKDAREWMNQNLFKVQSKAA